MCEGLDADTWEVLLDKVDSGKCTPFLGAGLNWGILPLGEQIASEWALKWKYPLTDGRDLARVSQFLAIRFNDSTKPKLEAQRYLQARPLPDFQADDPRLTCYKVLAALPLPVYVTTNYDGLLAAALAHEGKQARRELCRWNSALRRNLPPLDGQRPTQESPLIFHLHGSIDIMESIVITEDDYLDFLVNVKPTDQRVVPPRIQQALADSSLLFIGYSLKDINFRVLFRALVQSLELSQRKLSIAVQIDPSDHVGDLDAAKEYLNVYFKNWNIKMYWGSATQFAEEFRSKWRNRHAAGIGFGNRPI
jgi:hypothetical protein